MMFDDALVAAKLGDLEREHAAGALARTLTNLYGECRCARRAPEPDTPCERHTVDPSLFRRLVWSGLGS